MQRRKGPARVIGWLAVETGPVDRPPVETRRGAGLQPTERKGKIAELIRASSPFPSPGKLGAHTYVDTWLWDKSGNFQIDSLTLGQRSR